MHLHARQRNYVSQKSILKSLSLILAQVTIMTPWIT